MKIAVVIPVLEEPRAVLEALVVDVIVACREKVVGIHFVYSPRTSPETRAAIAKISSPLVVHYEQILPGVGGAYRDGLCTARRTTLHERVTHLLMLEGDGEADPSTIPSMLRAAEEQDADVVIASRWLPDSEIEGYRPDKLALNWGFNKLFGCLLRSPVHDHTFTFKLLRREVAEAFEWSAERQDIGSQTTMWPVAAGYKVVEVPTTWRARIGKSKGTLSLAGNLRHVRAGVEALKIRWGRR